MGPSWPSGEGVWLWSLTPLSTVVPVQIPWGVVSCQLITQGCWFTPRNNLFLQMWKLTAKYNHRRLKNGVKHQVTITINQIMNKKLIVSSTPLHLCGLNHTCEVMVSSLPLIIVFSSFETAVVSELSVFACSLDIAGSFLWLAIPKVLKMILVVFS